MSETCSLQASTCAKIHAVYRDLTSQNIMMDGRPIFPQGWHFVRRHFAPNCVDSVTPLARIDYPVRYFIIDYDCSIRFGPNQSSILEGFDGREGDPPELKKLLQYDAFKLDVFTLGHVFDRDLYQVRPLPTRLHPQQLAYVSRCTRG
jgi:hypothetical protein